jgi:hypothetical protein
MHPLQLRCSHASEAGNAYWMDGRMQYHACIHVHTVNHPRRLAGSLFQRLSFYLVATTTHDAHKRTKHVDIIYVSTFAHLKCKLALLDVHNLDDAGIADAVQSHDAVPPCHQAFALGVVYGSRQDLISGV